MPEGILEKQVSHWLEQQVPNFESPVDYQLITGGHSNLTFKCEDATGRAVVLRRPPLGHVLESAHDMSREYRIIHALRQTKVPVPEALGLCQDKTVNGADFYVMDFVEGVVLNDAVIGSTIPAQARPDLAHNVIHILCDLHDVDMDAVGLGTLGRKEAYLSRQLNRWNKQWQATKTHDIPEMEASSALLMERIPEQLGASIVHGDFRLGNMIVDQGRVEAILDWELCTLGDPLADLGYLLNNWLGEDEVVGIDVADQPPTAVGGYPSRDTLCELYCQRTGRDLSNINYYRAFQHWRLAAIGQGVYKRYLVGAMGEDHGVDLARQKEGVARRAEAAMELLQTS
ncbi:MAG: phosphotransferase family protein [Gammaproteobacteria bacterium]|nr:phosphotransferase family protein [Gammaproteobacteria bacterium]MBT5602038.1 phosphotransferase family protein [Gammaproteobacteria bacterium]MBT6247353.1 phosphotransferase family protein [Gammaproteobacteria bacterium]